jgi:hypothetical protein
MAAIRRFLVHLSARQHHPEARAVAQPFALGPDTPAVQLDQLLHQRETDAGPLVPAGVRGIHLGEAVEDALQLIRRQTGSRVRHRQLDAPILENGSARLDPPAPLRELQRIAHQVHDHLLDGVLVHVHDGQGPDPSSCQDHALALRERTRARDQILDQPPDLSRPPPDLELLPLDLRQVEEVVDELQQP